MAANALVSMGPEHTPLGSLPLKGLDWRYVQELHRMFGNPSQIWIQQMCSADDFKVYVPSVSLPLSEVQYHSRYAALHVPDLLLTASNTRRMMYIEYIPMNWLSRMM